MTKYQLGALLLIFAGVQLVFAMNIARLSKRKSSAQSVELDKEIARLNTWSKRVQVVGLGIALVVLGIGYFR